MKHSLPTSTVLLVAFLFVLGSSSAFGQKWKLSKDKQGVKVYTRYIKGWALKQFKGVVYIKSNLAAIEAAIRDSKGHEKWMHNTYNCYDAKKDDANNIYTYSVISAPWPVSHRDNVTHYQYKYISDKEFYVYFKNVSGIVAEKSGKVRIKKMQGYWHAIVAENGYIKVTQQAVAEAGGSIPAWLANSGVVDAPFNTLYNMKRYIESHPQLPVRR